MEKKNIDWANLGFGYHETDKRFVANYKNGSWDEGTLTSDDKVVISECAGVLQYAQTCFSVKESIHHRGWPHRNLPPGSERCAYGDSCRRLRCPYSRKSVLLTQSYRPSRQMPLMFRLRLRSNLIHPSVYVRKQRCHRCKTR